jgi:WD40 repeat protein
MKHHAQPARAFASSSVFNSIAVVAVVAALFVALLCVHPSIDGRAAQNKSDARPELVLQSGYAVYGASGMRFSPDARLLATWTFNSNGVKLWETATGRELRNLSLDGGGAVSGFAGITLTGVSAVAFSGDGHLVAAGGRNNSIKIWNVSTGREAQTLATQAGGLAATVGVSYLAFTPDSRRLVSVGDAVRTWDVATGGALPSAELGLFTAASASGGFSNPFALSPDGRQLAGLARAYQQGERARVTFWNLETGQVASSVNVPDDFKSEGAVSLAFAPDGRLLVASLDNSTENKSKFELWDFTAKGKPRQLATLDQPFGFFNFSADGRVLALASGAGVKLWDTATGAEMRALEAPSRIANLAPALGGVNALALSADGRTLATSSFDTDITLWETATGRRAGRLSGRSNMAYEVAFSADGSRLFSGSRTIWDLSTGRGLRAAPAANVESPLGVISPDGRLLASVSPTSNEVKLYDTADGRLLHAVAPREPVVTNFARFSPDSRQLATTYRAETYIRQDNTSTASTAASAAPGTDMKEMQKKAMEALREGRKNSKTAGSSGYGVVLNGNMAGGAAGIESQVKLWDTATGREARTLNIPRGNSFLTGAIHSVTFSPDGRALAVLNFNDPTVTIWDATTGARVQTLGGLTAAPASPANPLGMPNLAAMMGGGGVGGGGGTISSAAFSADGKLLLTGGSETTSSFDQAAMMRAMQAAMMQDPKKARRVNPEELMKEMYKDVKMNTTGLVKLWDVNSGREVRSLAGHTSAVKAVAIAADGRTIAAAAADNTVKLWDAATGRELRTLRGHAASVNSLAFSPDSRLLASASDDGSTVVWDAAGGKQLATLVSLYDGADWLVVTPDGLFDGSPAAWNQILWRYDEDTFNVAPIEWFFNEFFYPGLLSDLASGKRPAAAADFAQKDRRQPQVKIVLADDAAASPAPPATTAANPAAATTTGARAAATNSPAAPVVSTRNLKLRIEVREAAADAARPAAGGSGARDVRLFRNGTLVKAWRGDVLPQGGSGAATLEVVIPVVAGENRLTAYAFNRDNVKSKDTSLLVNGAESLRRAGVAYILAVGVNAYANSQYDLKYAVADAREFAEEVRRQQARLGRYERVEVASLYDAQATKANILAELSKLAGRAQPEDEVVIYFAGHGTAQANRFYLIPHDLGYTGSRTRLTADGLKLMLSQSISDVELEAAFELIPAAQMMLVIDACNSGQALEAEERRRGPMNSKGLAQLAYEKGMYILTAAQSFQAAQEASEVGHGLLTYALVEEGLKNSAADAQPRNGEILVREWFDYATTRVPAMQLQKLKQARDVGLNLSFVEVAGEDERGLNLTTAVTQRPRVFYRRELETQPLVVARTATK